jgi:type IV pilus assembly protein PilM
MLEAADSVQVEVNREATDAERDDAMRTALAVFLKRYGIRREPVFVSIPGHTTFNRVLRIPVMDEKKLDSTIRFEAQQQIPFPIEEVVWDYHPLPGASPAEMEISLYAVKNDFIRKFLHNMELAGLEPAGIQIAPLALFNFARFELDMRGANIILDVGSDASDLLVLDQDKTWMRTVPLAGNDVTKALEEKFKLPYEEAEKLKIKSGGSKQAQKIFGVMKPILTDLVSEVDRSLSYYRSQVPDAEFKECLLLGSGGKLVGIRKFLGETLEVDVTRVTSLKKVLIGPKVNVEFLQANLAGLPVALGLAIQALGKAANEVNFLPRALADAREMRRKRPWFAAAALVLWIGVLAAWSGASTLRAEYGTSMDKAGILDTFQKMEGKLDALKDDSADRDWLRARAEVALGRDDVFLAHRDAMNSLFPEDPDEDRPSMWLHSLEILRRADGRGVRMMLLGAMENSYEDDYLEKMKELGEKPDESAAKAAFEDMKRNCELEVKSLVLDPLIGAGCCSTHTDKGIQRKGTFVGDLEFDVHKGTRFYRFSLEWQYSEKE